MAETRAVRGNEGRGIAIAVAAHVLIIGLLSVQWTAGDRRFDNPPMEVDLIAESAVQSTAPIITEAPALASASAIEAPIPRAPPVTRAQRPSSLLPLMRSSLEAFVRLLSLSEASERFGRVSNNN